MSSASISTKKVYVHTDGWRGYEKPINAIAGANDTGSWEDSPCPTNVCLRELRKVKTALRKAGIRFKSIITRSSNVFCVHRYILVAPENKSRAIEIAKEQLEDTQLLYVED